MGKLMCCKKIPNSEKIIDQRREQSKKKFGMTAWYTCIGFYIKNKGEMFNIQIIYIKRNVSFSFLFEY